MHITYVAPLQSGDCRGAQRFERAGKIELSNYGLRPFQCKNYVMNL